MGYYSKDLITVEDELGFYLVVHQEVADAFEYQKGNPVSTEVIVQMRKKERELKEKDDQEDSS